MIDEETRAALASQVIGGAFVRGRLDREQVADLKDGRLLLRPHSVFEIPPRIDWLADPFGDRNWRAQFHMLRWLDPLRRAAADGDQHAFALWWSVVESWATACLDPDTAPAEAWMDMVDGIRAIELALGVLVVDQHEPSSLDRLHALLDVHGHWLTDHSHRGRANHALHQLQGLLLCGIARQRPDWVDQATVELVELFEQEYDDQGVNREGAIAYHLNNYTWWRIAAQRLALVHATPVEALSRLDLVPEELAHATQPDGTFVSIGNSTGGAPSAVPSPYTRYVTTEGSKGEAPEDLVRVYRAGYVFGRSGWGENERDLVEETFYSLVFGSSNKVHGHVDAGSLTYFAGGVPWLVDPGKFSYDDTAERIHFMERASHNVVTIEGLGYDKTTVVRLQRSAIHPNYHDFTLKDDGYGTVSITRRLVYSVTGEYLVVIDSVRSVDQVTAVQAWQLAPEVEATLTPRVVELRNGAARAAIFSLGLLPEASVAAGECDPLQGWVATGWRQRTPAPRVALRKSGTSFRFITLIAAGFRGADVRAKAVRGLPTGAFGVDVSTGRSKERIVITEGAVLFPSTEATPDEIAARLTARPPRVDEPRRVSYSQVRDAIVAAKQQRWHSGGNPAGTLRELLEDLGDPVVDHGLRAAIADLTNRAATQESGPWRQGLVNWDGQRGWMPTHYPLPVESRRVLGAGELPDQATILSYDLGHLTLPVAYLPGEGSVLTVLFHGALDRGRTRLPMFQRLMSQGAMGMGPVLAFADPTLDLSGTLRLGWYLGTAEIDLATVMADIVLGVMAGSDCEHVFLQGGSGGGFAAIATAIHVPGSVAIAFNPQTDVRRYSPTFVKACLAAVFPPGVAVGDSPPPGRMSLMTRMDTVDHIPHIELITNSGDEFHLTGHAAPLMAHVRAHAPEVLTVTELDLGPGHRTPDKGVYQQVMRSIYARHLHESRPRKRHRAT